MPLRKKIFFSFLAMIMIGFAQMISSVSGVRQLTYYSDGLNQTYVQTQRVSELTNLINQLLRYELGWCRTHPNPEPWHRLAEPEGPLYLENGPTRLECRFDCARCRMELVLRERA